MKEYLDIETQGFLKDMDDYYPGDKAAHDRGEKGVILNARDHGRFPVSWDKSKNGGFTSSDKPWMVIHPGYEEINVADQENDPNSSLSYYKKMIKFRKENKDLMVYGSFELLDKENDETMIYIKRYGNAEALVVLNFTKERVSFQMPSKLKGEAKLATSNYKNSSTDTLEPYEARVYLVNV
jgi:oligo-1,6-glucosidase